MERMAVPVESTGYACAVAGARGSLALRCRVLDDAELCSHRASAEK
jgi:hypothetical protein